MKLSLPAPLLPLCKDNVLIISSLLFLAAITNKSNYERDVMLHIFQVFVMTTLTDLVCAD